MLNAIRNPLRYILFNLTVTAVVLMGGAVCAACTPEAIPPETAATAASAVNIANELCSLDLSKAPTVKEAALKYGAKVVEYARKICGDAKLAEPYARLLGESGETGDLVSPLEEARQRAIERGQAAGVL